MTSQAPPAGRISPRLVAASIAGLWLCYFVLASVRGAVMGFPSDWPMLSRRIVVTLASMGTTALLWPVLHGLQRRELWVKAAAVMLAALPVSLLLSAINAWVFADIQAQSYSQLGKDRNIMIRRDQAGNVLVDVGEPAADKSPAPGKSRTVVMIGAKEDEETYWQQLTEVALGRYFVLLAWAALYLALASAEKTRAAERREGEYRRAAKAAELRSLRYQINPHFLFNTLNSLSALVLTGRAEAAERMIQTLSTFYRRSLAEEPTADHTLAEEVELQGLYLDIEKVRFPDRLATRLAIPDALKTCLVPGMILQPLVENSVKYAVAPHRRAVTIEISACEEMGRLVVTVADDEPLAVERLQLICVGLAGLTVVGTAGDGAAALTLAQALSPDLLLLDLTMPEIGGLDVARALTRQANPPAVIFVTAHDGFAVEAFDLDAVDYVLKPVAPERLQRAIDRVMARRGARERRESAWLAEFWVPHRAELLRIPVGEVDRICAERDYVRLHVGARSYLLLQTIAGLEARLDPERFLRLHRSTILPRDRIAGLRHEGLGVWSAELADGQSVRIGKTYLARAKAMAGR